MNLDSLRLGIRYSDAGIARRSYVTLYIITRLLSYDVGVLGSLHTRHIQGGLSMRLWSSGRQSGSFGIEFLRFCK